MVQRCHQEESWRAGTCRWPRAPHTRSLHAYSWSVGVFGVRIATRGMEVQGEGGRPFTVRGYSKGRPPSPWLAMVRGEATARPHPTWFPGSTKRLLNVSNRATVRWRASRCYEFSTPTVRCLTQVFRAAGALCFHNELSESVWNHQDSTISLSVKQSQLASGKKEPADYGSSSRSKWFRTRIRTA